DDRVQALPEDREAVNNQDSDWMWLRCHSTPIGCGCGPHDPWGIATQRLSIAISSFARSFAAQRAHMVHQIPNVIRRFDLPEGRHSGETDSVLDDPKQLLIGVALHLLRGEIRRAWIHPSADGHLGMTVGSMAHTAIVAVKHSSTTIDASFSDLG